MRLGIYLWFSLVLFSVEGWTPTSRLQRNVIPNSYSLKIVPNLNTSTFWGEVTIFVKIQQSMNNITLNSISLNISEITLDQSYGTTGYELDSENELLHVFFSDKHVIDPGEHILNIKYNGSLHSDLTGFYIIKYSPSGIPRTMLATKFSPMYARRAFPCFDEPYFKSIFSIRLVKPDETWKALSNMKEIRRFNTPEGIAVDFQSTTTMSTYLLAWILTDYSSDEIHYNANNRSISLRFFSADKKTTNRREVLKTTKKALEFFENYTGILYPLPKLDSIEVPFYISRGMEHWGLIAYLENSITYNPFSPKSQLIHSIEATELITHEVSHMWFGNLVTHGWYNDIWLTEGFARFMQYKASTALLGKPFIKRLFQRNKYLYLFNTQCMEMSVETAAFLPPAEVFALFGSTTYDQGAALLLMVENVIGLENFQVAIRMHLQKHKYSLATTGDFLNTIDAHVPDFKIRSLMETYLFQKNLPFIRVTENNQSFILEQEPFCIGGEKSFFGNKWTIPVNYITSSNMINSTMVWFDKDMTRVVIPKAKDDKWIKLNYQNWGLYYAAYTDVIYDAIRADFKKFSLDDRGPFIEEMFVLARHEVLSCSIPLRYMLVVKNLTDMDFITFTYSSRSFSIFQRTSNFDNDVVDLLKSYYIYIFEALYEQVEWIVGANDSIEQRLLRMAVLESICLYDYKYPNCTKDAENMRLQNTTVHEDLGYIYRKIIQDVDRANLPSMRFENKTSTSPPQTMTPAEEKCSIWIKENIPKIMKQPEHKV